MQRDLIQAAAVLVSGAMIAGVLAVSMRWEIATSSNFVHRLDRWTGQIVECNATDVSRAIARVQGVAVAFNCAPASKTGALPYTEDLLDQFAPKRP